MSLIISSVFTYDEEAGNYIQAVEAADGQALEPATRKAINDFVIGCKQDGIWTAIKASCILAGARTLNGALVPLVGTAPTRFGTEGGWNYNRKTGLQGNGTNNYLSSNRNNNAEPQNNVHQSVYGSTFQASGVGLLIGAGSSTGATGATHVNVLNGNFDARCQCSASALPTGRTIATGFVGVSRVSSADYNFRYGKTNNTVTAASQTPFNGIVQVFAGDFVALTTSRLAFYSIGEALNLTILDARVTTLINTFSSTIP